MVLDLRIEVRSSLRFAQSMHLMNTCKHGCVRYSRVISDNHFPAMIPGSQ